MFPAGKSGQETTSIETSDQAEEDEATTNKLRSVLSKSTSRRAISDESAAQMENPVPRPGSRYKSYRSEADLPETARAFYESAAKMAGVSLSTLVRIVKLAENRIEKLECKTAGEQAGGNDSEGEEVPREDLMDIDMED